MSPSDYRNYIQTTLKECDFVGISSKKDFTEIIDRISVIKKIGESFNNYEISNYSLKIPLYSSEEYKLDFLGKILFWFSLRLTGIPLSSNKEHVRQKRYLIDAKLFLHGIDEELRKLGH